MFLIGWQILFFNTVALCYLGLVNLSKKCALALLQSCLPFSFMSNWANTYIKSLAGSYSDLITE